MYPHAIMPKYQLGINGIEKYLWSSPVKLIVHADLYCQSFNRVIPNPWIPYWSLFLFMLHLNELQLLEKQIKTSLLQQRKSNPPHTTTKISVNPDVKVSLIAVSPIQSVSSQRKVRKQEKLSKTAERKDQKKWLGRIKK